MNLKPFETPLDQNVILKEIKLIRIPHAYMVDLNTFETICRGMPNRVPLPDKQSFPVHKMFQGSSSQSVEGNKKRNYDSKFVNDALFTQTERLYSNYNSASVMQT